MNAFRASAPTKGAGIATVASGISEALVTTALGLLVAVPAVWCYNYFTRQSGRLRRGNGKFVDGTGELPRAVGTAANNFERLGWAGTECRDPLVNTCFDAHCFLNYASAMFDSKAGLWIEGALLLLGFFVVAPSIAAMIGYAAWRANGRISVEICIGRHSLSQWRCLFF